MKSLTCFFKFSRTIGGSGKLFDVNSENKHKDSSKEINTFLAYK